MRARLGAILLAVVGCAGGTTPPLPDVLQSEAGQDFVLLQDAIVLEPGNIAEEETTDTPGLPRFDASVPDLPLVRFEIREPDHGPPSDPGPVSVWCGSCPEGEGCVDLDNDGVFACEPVAGCSKEGVSDLKLAMAQLLSTGHIYAKLEVKVQVGKPACTEQKCPKSNPCCNQCFASLFVGPEDFPIFLLGKGLPVGCPGTNCDFKNCDESAKGCEPVKVCAPFTPGKYYWLWGDIDLTWGQAQMRLDGWCLVL